MTLQCQRVLLSIRLNIPDEGNKFSGTCSWEVQPPGIFLDQQSLLSAKLFLEVDNCTLWKGLCSKGENVLNVISSKTELVYHGDVVFNRLF